MFFIADSVPGATVTLFHMQASMEIGKESLDSTAVLAMLRFTGINFLNLRRVCLVTVLLEISNYKRYQ